MKNDEPQIVVKPLAKWVMISYANLWKRFQDKEFDHTQATRLLRRNTSVLLSSLKKAGWLTIQLHPRDSRKRVYLLKNPRKAVEEMKR